VAAAGRTLWELADRAPLIQVDANAREHLPQSISFFRPVVPPMPVARQPA
jgi:hypothetical protein